MFHLDTLATLVAATLTLLLGRKLVHSVSFLKKYTIPEPVAGGLLVALALLVLKKSMGWEVNFDMSLRDPLMLAFFATIGLNANIASLRAGGRVVGIFLIVVVGLLVMQNAIGIGMASLLGLDPLMGLLAGSITLSGGHGTGAAWSKLFIERYGFTNATEVAMACATFGLGLAQLHQLRGRVGRGAVASHCVLLYKTPLSKTAQIRLQVLRDSNDGFVIAQKDLEIRGPGELLGTRQTGNAEFKVADLLRDQAMIPEVQRLARHIHERYPQQAKALIERWMPETERYSNA